jgi:predicted RNA-binding Zn-ribbon protein involved in translation (DUF1610 family)
MKKLLRCPFCLNDDAGVISTETGYTVVCPHCLAAGPKIECSDTGYALFGSERYESKARRKWNNRDKKDAKETVNGHYSCPFCGSTCVEILETTICREHGQHIACAKCGASGPFCQGGYQERIDKCYIKRPSGREWEWKAWNQWDIWVPLRNFQRFADTSLTD